MDDFPWGYYSDCYYCAGGYWHYYGLLTDLFTLLRLGLATLRLSLMIFFFFLFLSLGLSPLDQSTGFFCCSLILQTLLLFFL
jgi:hypothetical protein